MLYSIDSQKYIRQIPYEADFRRARNKLTNTEFLAIQSDLMREWKVARSTRLAGFQVTTGPARFTIRFIGKPARET